MKFQSIQALRGIAALLVVIYHGATFEGRLISENGFQETPLIGGLFLSGYAGVDLFFVISGFIMVWVTQDTRPALSSSADFLFARLVRVYPLWWLAAGLMVVYGLSTNFLALLAPGGGGEAPVRNSADYLAKSFLLIPQAELPVLLVGWTLVHEVYFYCVFALLMLAPRALLPWALMAWGGVVVAASFAGLAEPVATGFVTLAVHPMTVEFILGALAGLLVTSGIRRRGGVVTLVATLWLTSSLCLQGPPDEHTLLWGRVLLFGLPCTALVYGVASLEGRERVVWLIPAAAGAVVCASLFQLYGLNPGSPAEARTQAVTVAAVCGMLAMACVLWAGWLGGMNFPRRMHDLGPPLRRVFAFLGRTGDWSYSIYLLHLFVLGVLKWVFSWAGQNDALAPVFRVGAPGLLDNLAFLGCGVAGTLLAGWLGYSFIERPLTRGFGLARRRIFHRRQDMAAVS
jgi:exopolysaccharide production protein ExoZ